MRLLKKAKSLFLSTVQTVSPQSKTAVLSRTDAATGVKQPMFARAEVRPDNGLPSERFDPRQLARDLGQSGQTSQSKRIYETPPTRPGYKFEDR